MSKAELLKEISKLTPTERGEIWDALWTLQEQDLLEPSDDEKAVLDRELEDFKRNPWTGSSWEEVKARLELDT